PQNHLPTDVLTLPNAPKHFEDLHGAPSQRLQDLLAYVRRARRSSQVDRVRHPHWDAIQATSRILQSLPDVGNSSPDSTSRCPSPDDSQASLDRVPERDG